MAKKQGQIIIDYGAHPRSHEVRTAKSLAAAGYSVRFVAKSEIDGERTADVVMDGVAWEMKAPDSNSKKAIERNMHKGLRQSCNLIIDSRRMRDIPGSAIEREVRALAPKLRSLKRLIFVNRLGEVIEIK